MCSLNALFFCFSTICQAQIEIASGGGLGYPEVLARSKILNSGQLSFGGHVEVSYEPEDLQFFPGLAIGYDRVRLPLQESGNNIAALNVNQFRAVVSEHFIPDISNGRHWLISGGIGLCYCMATGTAPSGNQIRETTIDSTANIRKLFPEMNLGVAWCFGGQTDKDFYVTLELNIQYTLLLSGYNTYYVTVEEQSNNIYHYQSGLSGNLVTPWLSVVLHDKIKRRRLNRSE